MIISLLLGSCYGNPCNLISMDNFYPIRLYLSFENKQKKCPGKARYPIKAGSCTINDPKLRFDHCFKTLIRNFASNDFLQYKVKFIYIFYAHKILSKIYENGLVFQLSTRNLVIQIHCLAPRMKTSSGAIGG